MPEIPTVSTSSKYTKSFVFALAIFALFCFFGISKAHASNFTIGGTVINSLPGANVTLQDNGGDDLVITPTSSTSFTFATPLATGVAYNVTVSSQPTDNETCTVINGSGTVGTSNVTNIQLGCAINNYSVSGTLSGFTGSSLSLTDVIGNPGGGSGADPLTVSANGGFTFTDTVPTGWTYNVQVTTVQSNQYCAVSNASGTMGTSNVTNISISCAPAFTIGGTISGVTGSNGNFSAIYSGNGKSGSLSLTNGSFTFSQGASTGTTYTVSIGNQPSGQVCSISNASGTVSSSNITNVGVICVAAHSVSYTVSGLSGGQVSVQINQNGTNYGIQTSTTDGTGDFTGFPSGSTYNVIINSQPNNGRYCTVTNGSGTIASADVTNVAVNCVSDPGSVTYTIGGTVSGLTGSVVLQNNGGDNLTVSTNGSFTFASPLPPTAPYAVTVLTQPNGSVCSVSNDSGTVSSANITNVSVSCTTGFTVSGNLSGLTSGSVVLQNNGGDNLTVSANGSFTFATILQTGNSYAITVLSQPSGQTCTATNGSGTVASSNVTNVSVTCITNTFTFTGPSAGIVNNASTNFTVTPNFAYSGTITITPIGGGLSTPIVLTFSNSSVAQTFTITPPSTGTVTLTPTNNSSLPNPSALAYVSNASNTAPGAPTGVSATAGNASASVTFSAPGSNGGATITGYTVISNPTGGTDSNAGSTSLTHSVTGLTNGVAYTFTVTATNSVGTGSASSASNSVTPATVPGAPTGVSATAGNASATVTFSAPGSNGGSAITGYTVISNPAGGTDSNTGSTSLTHTITGLTNSTAYTFTVTATNAIGTSSASSASNSVTPAATATTFTFTGPSSGTVNTASTNFTVTPNAQYSGTITITPSGGGLSSPIVLTFSASAVAQTFTITPTATGTVTLTPTNNGSLTNPSALSYSSITVPGAPTSASATAGNASASVTFVAPGSNGGSAIIGYTVISNPAGGTDSNAGSTSLTHSITGLTNGTPYTFTVTATNAAGAGSASTASNSVTPFIPATTFMFTGPTSGTVNVASSNFTVTPNAQYSGTITITPSGGGLSTPIVLTFSASSVAQTFTITPSAVGTVTLTPTNNGSLTNPSARSYTSNAALTVPGAPTSATATAGNASASVTFTAPGSNGGATITGYTVISNPAGGTDTNAGSTSLTHGMTGLTNGVAYTFTVTATNSVGTGPASSASNSVTPATVPGAPTSASATAGNASATITFVAPSSNGGSSITGYTVISNPAGGTDSNAGSTSLTHTITGLANGTPYTFTVTATNAVGTGSASTASNSITPVSVPGAPTGATATAGNASASVTFTAPAANGGSAITGYTVISNPAGGTDTNAGSTALTHSVTGLTNGTAYTFTVTATNSIGAGSASSASNSVTPATVPGAPTSVTATAGNTSASVTFTAPGSNGGSTITGYTVTSNPAGGIDSNAGSTLLTHTITGLTNSTSYTFTVRATNSVGSGSASSASNSIIPIAPANSYIFTGPGSGAVNAASTNFTVTPNATYSGTITITPSGGGISSPIVLTFSSSSTPQTFTITPTATGTVTLTPTNNGSLTNPSSLGYSALTTPGAPTSATAIAGNASATVSFTTPGSNGGTAITGYTVISNPADGTDTNAGSTALTHSVTGLTNNTAYTFTVTATNSIGTGSASSASNSVTPIAPASTFTFTGPSSGSVNSASTNFSVTPNAAYTGTITITPSGAGLSIPVVLTFSNSAAAQTFTITPTSVGSATLTASNNGSLTNPSALSYTSNAVVAGAPTTLVATPGDTQVFLSWIAPAANGGAAISDYLIQYRLTGATPWTTFTHSASTATSTTITGLTDNSGYDFQVSAVNTAGTGSASTIATATPVSTPGPVISAIGTASIDTTDATITWTTDVIGTTQLSYGTATGTYTTTTTLTDSSPMVTAHSVVLSGLTPSTTYYYVVISSNGVSTISSEKTFTTSAISSGGGGGGGGGGFSTPTASAITSKPASTSAVITWSTSIAADSNVDYGLSTSYGSTAPYVGTAVFSHSISITGLLPATTYHYRVKSTALGFTPIVSGDQTFTTLSVGSSNTPPTTPPSSPTPATTFPSGTLVNDNGTIYLISGTKRTPFTSSAAFLGLGYSFNKVILGNTLAYPNSGYVLDSATKAHPWSSWLSYNGVVYYVAQTGLIPVPSENVLAANGGSTATILPMNTADQALLPEALPIMVANDSRILAGQTTTTTPSTFSNGALVNDKGTIYLISGTKRTAFTTSSAFLGLGYSFNNVVSGDTSSYGNSGYMLDSATKAHAWFSWLINKGVVYYATQAGLIPVPSENILSANGGANATLLPMNSADQALLPHLLSLMTANDSRVIH